MPTSAKNFNWMICVIWFWGPDSLGRSKWIVWKNVMVNFVIKQKPLFPDNFLGSDFPWIAMKDALWHKWMWKYLPPRIYIGIGNQFWVRNSFQEVGFEIDPNVYEKRFNVDFLPARFGCLDPGFVAAHGWANLILLQPDFRHILGKWVQVCSPKFNQFILEEGEKPSQP